MAAASAARAGRDRADRRAGLVDRERPRRPDRRRPTDRGDHVDGRHLPTGHPPARAPARRRSRPAGSRHRVPALRRRHRRPDRRPRRDRADDRRPPRCADRRRSVGARRAGPPAGRSAAAGRGRAGTHPARGDDAHRDHGRARRRPVRVRAQRVPARVRRGERSAVPRRRRRRVRGSVGARPAPRSLPTRRSLPDARTGSCDECRRLAGVVGGMRAWAGSRCASMAGGSLARRSRGSIAHLRRPGPTGTAADHDADRRDAARPRPADGDSRRSHPACSHRPSSCASSNDRSTRTSARSPAAAVRGSARTGASSSARCRPLGVVSLGVFVPVALALVGLVAGPLARPQPQSPSAHATCRPICASSCRPISTS